MDSAQTETLIMSNGSVYTGEVKDGLPNGQGTMNRQSRHLKFGNAC